MEVSAEEYRKMKADPNYKPKRPHKHAELIKAWADGAEIQVLHSGTYWKDVLYPYWHEDVQYRIKPKTIRYRLYLAAGSSPYIIAVDNGADLSMYTHGKWLSDWIEVEV